MRHDRRLPRALDKQGFPGQSLAVMSRHDEDTSPAPPESTADPRCQPGALDLAVLVWTPDGLLHPICCLCGTEVAVRVIANHYMREHPDVALVEDE